MIFAITSFQGLSANCAEQFMKAFEAGLDSPELVALHATSLEAVDRTLRTGKLPSGLKSSDPKQDTEGYIYLWPLRDRLSGHPSNSLFFERIEALRLATEHAQARAYNRAFATRLGLDLSDPEVYDGVETYRQQKNNLHWFYDRGVDPSDLQEAHELARNSSGVVLGVSANAIEAFEVFDGDIEIIGPSQDIYDDPLGTYDIKLKTPDGLPAEFIVGIEPLGDREFNYLETLQLNREAAELYPSEVGLSDQVKGQKKK